MPAVSAYDPVAITLRRTLDSANRQKSDDFSVTLAESASRILETEIEYDECDNYHTTVLDRLKNKYIVLSLPKDEESAKKNGSTCTKKGESKSSEPRLPEPKHTLYPSSKLKLGWNNEKVPIGAGMYNVGNTCYLNSTLQALFHVPALVNWLLSDSHHMAKCEQNGELWKDLGFCRLFIVSVYTDDFIKCLRLYFMFLMVFISICTLQGRDNSIIMM